MRISDWSSDVLFRSRGGSYQGGSGKGRRFSAGAGCRQAGLRPICGRFGPPARTARRRPCARIFALLRSEERRVGKSVSVRVDLGGRRIIKKKTNNKHNRQL